MKLYKWLAGFVTAIFFTLIIAWFSSYFFKIDVDWYNLLNKPYFTPSAFVFELCVTINYLFLSITLARLIVTRNFGLILFFIILSGALSVFFVLTFFYYQNIYIATIIMSVIFILSMSINVLSFIRDILCAVAYLPVTVWNTFLFILIFAIALHN